MPKLWIILRQEYLQVVKKKSFIIGIILTPLLMSAFMLIPAMLADTKASSSERMAIIDQSGAAIGQQFADAIDEYRIEDSDNPYYAILETFVLDPTDEEGLAGIEDSLRQAIIDKELKYFLVVKENAHLNDENIYLVTNSDNFRTIGRFERKLSDILSANRLELSQINLGVDSVLKLTEQIDLQIQDAKGESIPFVIKYFGALIFVMIMFGTILTYGTLVMRTIIEEKNSRIMEVLVSSASPFELMLGKVLGLGAATFTQVAVWIAVGFGIMGMGSTLAIAPAISRIVFNPVIIFFFATYLIFGYLMYSTIFALIGSIVNSEKEAQNFIFPVTMSLILPVMIGVYVAQEPYSPLVLTVSYIPFFTPTMMMMRVVFIAPTVMEYSLFSGILGEATLGLILVILATLGIVWLTSKVFRVGILMYGKQPTLMEIVKWVRYR